MSNKEYFDWLYERLIHVYNENPNVDFIQSFKKRADWLIQNTIGWISVKDRLPEKNGWYFTCVEQFKIPQCVGITYFDKKDGWWLNDIPMTERIFVSTIEIVDYWMEIPALPKEEEEWQV